MQIIELNGKKFVELAVSESLPNQGFQGQHEGQPKVGQKVFVRTVTYHHVGVIAALGPKWMVLQTASWVADSGRWNEAISKGTLNEVEFEGSTTINVDSIVDITPWNHPLPTESK